MKARLVLLMVGIMAIGSWAWAQERAPLNPEFQQYLDQQAVKGLQSGEAVGPALGYIPPPVKLPSPAVALPQAKVRALPPSYDLRNYGKVSSVKDQGNYGTCWTFATFGSMESCLLTGETWDFSENNLANLHGGDWVYDDGGNSYRSLAYLCRWSGPVNEADDPYSNGPGGSPSGLPVRKHVETAQWIPDRTGPTDNDKIKQAIMAYGGMYSTFRWVNGNYNSANAAYYYSGTNYGNHAITLVGWDDTFSRTNFNTTPAGDGAFLIKNSWSDTWGQSGYAWVSYYDSRMGEENCLFLSAASTANYESVYQYDTLGYCASFGYGSTTAWGANIFTNTTGTIKAVSFYAAAPGASCEVRVYTGVSEGNPVSGTLSATKSGTLIYAGYYTVVLDTPVSCSTRFSVVVKFTTPGFKYPIPVEYPISGYSSRATARAGESYISDNGSSWDEAVDDGVYYNVCIKAFGTGGGQAPVPESTVIGPLIKANGSTNDISIHSGDNLSLTVQLDPGQYNGVDVDWWIVTLANGGWYYLDGSMQWNPFDGNPAHCYPVYWGGLFNLPATEVLNRSGLPLGSYTFWFAVDYPMDGVLDVNGQILLDSVNVTVQ